VLEDFQQQGVIGQLGISNCYDLRVLQAIYNDAKVGGEEGAMEGGREVVSDGRTEGGRDGGVWFAWMGLCLMGV
jgi:hypothetical protein